MGDGGKKQKPKQHNTNKPKTKTKLQPTVAAEFFTSLFSGHRHQQQNREHFNATEQDGRGNAKQMGNMCTGYTRKYMQLNGRKQAGYSGLLDRNKITITGI